MRVYSNHTSIGHTQELVTEFQRHTGLSWEVPQDLADALEDVFASLGSEGLRPAADRADGCFAAINAKLKLGQPSYKRTLDAAAEHGVPLHYHQKAALQRAIDDNDRTAFFEVLLQSSTPPRALNVLAGAFMPPNRKETCAALRADVAEDERAPQTVRAIFSAYAFSCFETHLIHKYFTGQDTSLYRPRFYDHLRHSMPEVVDRRCGLAYLRIDDDWLGTSNDVQRQMKVLRCVHGLAEKLSNHCYLAVLLKPLAGSEGRRWALYSDIILYLEKSRCVPLKKGYFQPDKIARQTQDYIPGLDPACCRFELANEGLFYKDCFVITYQPRPTGPKPQGETDLLLLFEKNERDETPIPCPACRSLNVQGNSYPVLGVRSWECNNLICPERSKYDRGNRYSLSALIRQEAIEEEDAVIPLSSLRLWKRDVVALDSEQEILEMLVRHYSLLNDRVTLVNVPEPTPRLYGRRFRGVHTRATTEPVNAEDHIGAFFDGPYFRRFRVDRRREEQSPRKNMSEVKGVETYCGDCFRVLQQLGNESVAGIITSPPYYNAREYAQWPNIYCFLYDQYNVLRELYRVLKSGGIFLYNIFDYFDNENNIVSSAMGKKRMLLGAYAIHLFRRCGFSLVKNIVWDKGEIEGKRNFNQGNRSPYYQAPFNCWEHLLVFSKGTPAVAVERLPDVLRAQPVIKMVGGRNILGHTAPFPEAIPNLILDLLPPHSTVLDPFAGSMTTARAAYKRGLRSISIDYKEEYCRLGLDLLMGYEQSLFAEDSQV